MEGNYVSVPFYEYEELIQAKVALKLIKDTQDDYGYNTAVITAILESVFGESCVTQK